MSIKMIVIEDEALVRAALGCIIQQVAEFELVAEAATGKAGIALVKEYAPEIVLLNIALPDMSGIEVTKRLLAYNKRLKVLGVSGLRHCVYLRRLLAAGAMGFVSKEAGASDLKAAIWALHRGEYYLSHHVQQTLAMREAHWQNCDLLKTLNDKELEVTLAILRGKEAIEIAQQLHLAPKTVNTYKARIRKKLNVRTDVELLRLAIRHGIIEPVTLKNA